MAWNDNDGGTGEISSPPYPNLATATVRSVYPLLGDLGRWVAAEYGSVLHAFAGTATVDADFSSLVESAQQPTRELWDSMSIADHHEIMMALRAARENWDAVVREFELAWDSKPALLRRLSVVVVAAALLANRFMSPELRELRNHEFSKERDIIGRALAEHHAKIIETYREANDPG